MRLTGVPHTDSGAVAAGHKCIGENGEAAGSGHCSGILGWGVGGGS